VKPANGLYAGATVGVLAVLWAGAAVANDAALWTGERPTPVGISATVLLLVGWLASGALWGLWAPSRFTRYAVAFWGAVALCAATVVWLLQVPLTVSQGAGLVLWVARGAMSPLYGLTGVFAVPAEPFRSILAAGLGLSLSLAAYFVASASASRAGRGRTGQTP
jgi:hypothetical protein